MRFCMNRYMSDQASGNVLVIQQKLTANLKTSLVNLLWSQSHDQSVSPVDRFFEACAAMHHRERCVRPALLTATARKHRFGFNAVKLQALFPSFMAPAQQLVEMHDPRSIRVSETHGSGEVEPWKLRHQAIIVPTAKPGIGSAKESRSSLASCSDQRSTDPMITSIEPRIAMMSATLCPLRM